MKQIIISLFLFLSIQLSATVAPKIELYYFYDESCGICTEIKQVLIPKFEKEFKLKLTPHFLKVEKSDNMGKLIFIERARGFKGAEFPVVIIGTNYLAGEENIKQNLSPILSAMSVSGRTTNMATTILKSYKPPAPDRLLSKLKPLPVILSGLVDGVNPCAFATLIFLLSYLFFVKMGRGMVLRMGIAYTLGVFFCYFAIGLGAFSALRAVSTFKLVAMIIKYVSVGFVAVFFVLSIIDIIGYIRTRKTDFILQLPDSIKKNIHARIRSEVSPAISLSASFGLGVVIAFLELACTGQIYLPTIIYILQTPELKLQGVGYLLLYNIAFILPLVAVFILAWFGLEKDRVEKLFKKNIIWLKLLLAVVFILLLAYLLK